jgi:two-component system, NtrC family, response regulator GlrR
MTEPTDRRARVLLVDDDPGLLRLLTIRLRAEGYLVAACENAAQALSSLPKFRPDVVLSDLRMAEMDGLALLKELQRRYPTLPVIIMTAHGTIPDAVAATKSGAFAFLTKPIDKDQLLEQLSRAMSVSGFSAANDDWRADIVTRNPAMDDRLTQAQVAAGSDSSVLITGPSGTGKRLLARAIHRASSRRNAPLIVLDCNSLHVTRIYSDDTEAGARSSQADPDAAFRAARGGSVLLDEIGDLPAAEQALLLGLLDQHSRAAGGQPVPVRMLATCAKDVAQLIARNSFREDLFYRLAGTQIDLPPLARRREDIPLLAAHFLDRLASGGERKILAPEAVELLMAADWPGNVQQLAATVRQSAGLARGPVISADLVQGALGGASRVPSFDEARDEFTRSYLEQLLRVTRGNVTQAARLAKRNRTDFYKLLSRHGLSTEEFKV